MPPKTPQTPAEMMQEAMKNLPKDLQGLAGSMKHSAEISERLAKVALEAAEKSNEISSAWTREALSNARSLTTAQENPADLAKAMSDFAAAQGELAARNVNAFAEIAKSVQTRTIEILMQGGAEATSGAGAGKDAGKPAGKGGSGKKRGD